MAPSIMEYKFINTEYLDSLSVGDPDVITEIAVMFKDQSDEIYTEMKSHLAVKNYHLLKLLAHKAKSSATIMGMNDLATMLKNFESEAGEGKRCELYESYINRFKIETDAAVSELEDLVNNRRLKEQ